MTNKATSSIGTLVLGLALGHGVVLAQTPYQQAVLADEPVSYFSFEKDVKDAGSGRNDAEAGSATKFVEAFLPALGGSAVSFDGTEGSLVTLGATADSGSLLFDLDGAEAVTIEFWTDFGKLDDKGGVFYVPGPGDPPPGYAVLSARIGNVGQGGCAVGGRASPKDEFQELYARSKDGGTKPAHIVGILDFANGKIDIFINGNLVQTEVKPFKQPMLKIPGGTNPIVIGRNSDLVLSGPIDELAIYNKALSPERIRAHYEAGLGGN